MFTTVGFLVVSLLHGGLIGLGVAFKVAHRAEAQGSFVDLGIMVWWWTDTNIYLLIKNLESLIRASIVRSKLTLRLQMARHGGTHL